MSVYDGRIKRAVELMMNSAMDALILTKPANMFYLTGDGRLCAYAMVTLGGKVAMGLPQTDLEEIRSLARFDHVVWGIRDEDTVVVGTDGPIVLTNYPRQLECDV